MMNDPEKSDSPIVAGKPPNTRLSFLECAAAALVNQQNSEKPSDKKVQKRCAGMGASARFAPTCGIAPQAKEFFEGWWGGGGSLGGAPPSRAISVRKICESPKRSLTLSMA
jgi:hypothetical protein